MKFPKSIKHRGYKAKIYGKRKNYPYYRIAYYTAGKRHIRNFRTFCDANKEAERIVRDLANGSQSAALTAANSRDAIAALECLETYRQASGRRVSLLAAVSEFVEVSRRLGTRTINEAASGFLQTVATVKRKDVAEAVAEFLLAAEPRTKAKDGEHAQLSPKEALIKSASIKSDLIFAIKSPSDEIKIASTPSSCVEFH